MFDKLVKVMAIVGALCMAAILIGAASITLLNNNTSINGTLSVSSNATVAGSLTSGSLSTAGNLTSGDASVTGNLSVNGIPYAYVPTGTIVAFWGGTAPDGWLLCNGSTIPGGTQYAALKNLCGNNVPDLRGVFLRGVDSGRGLDTARNIGNYQSDAFQDHQHTLYSVTWGDAGGNEADDAIRDVGNQGNNNMNYGGNQGQELCRTSLPNGNHESETRPKNIAVNYIIKY